MESIGNSHLEELEREEDRLESDEHGTLPDGIESVDHEEAT